MTEQEWAEIPKMKLVDLLKAAREQLTAIELDGKAGSYQQALTNLSRAEKAESALAEMTKERDAWSESDKAATLRAMNAESALERARNVVEAARPFARKWEQMLPSITYQDSEKLQSALAVHDSGR